MTAIVVQVAMDEEAQPFLDAAAQVSDPVTLGRAVHRGVVIGGATLVLVVSGIFVYSIYVSSPGIVMGVASFVLFQAGFAAIWGAGYQFRTNRLPLAGILIRALSAMLLPVGAMATGYDGLGFIADNTSITLLLLATALQYWRARAEAPAPIMGITVLYTLTGISFALCAAVLPMRAPRRTTSQSSTPPCRPSRVGITPSRSSPREARRRCD